jgi:flagellin
VSLSVNTNNGAMLALRNLNATNTALETTNLRITTGLKVNGPKDDASTYAIAQNMRGEIAGMRAVKTALANGAAVVNVAIEGGKSIADLLVELKAKTVQANQAGLDAASRTALTNDFFALRDQIDTTVATAEFNGINLLKNGASGTTVLSTVDGSTIAVSAQNMSAIFLQFGQPYADLSSSSNASQTLSLIESATISVSDSLAALGSVARRIEVQSEFTAKLTDIQRAGVGNLVDADLAEESANLQAQQIKQQLGVQALSIANSSPQAILSLFG